MPELGIKTTVFIEAVKNYPGITWLGGPTKWELEILRRKYDQDVIGSGCVSVVIPHSKDADKVQAFNYFEQSKTIGVGTFYIHRIFSTLFPDNFPRVYACFWQDLKNSNPFINSGTVRQKIVGVNPPIALFKRPEQADLNQYPTPFWKVVEDCQKYQIPLEFDRYGGNFIVTKDGHEYYVDTLIEHGEQSVKKFIPALTPDIFTNVLTYLRESDFPQSAKYQVLSAFERLEQLSDHIQTN